MEALSVLVSAGYVPRNHSVEFHCYSAEEGGMLGSQGVTRAFAQEGRRAIAMWQIDMSGYIKPGTDPRIGIIQDFVDADLTAFAVKLAAEYVLDAPAVKTKCGYACSDHSSWTKVGVPSAFTIENTFEDSNTGAIHSTRDTIDLPGFSFDHMARFTRLAISFIRELAD